MYGVKMTKHGLAQKVKVEELHATKIVNSLWLFSTINELSSNLFQTKQIVALLLITDTNKTG